MAVINPANFPENMKPHQIQSAPIFVLNRLMSFLNVPHQKRREAGAICFLMMYTDLPSYVSTGVTNF